MGTIDEAWEVRVTPQAVPLQSARNERRQHRHPGNPTCPVILGCRPYQSVSDRSSRRDLVVVFRRSWDISDVVRDVIEASPKYRWLQSAIRNDEAVLDVESRGIRVYPDICIEQTHQ